MLLWYHKWLSQNRILLHSTHIFAPDFFENRPQKLPQKETHIVFQTWNLKMGAPWKRRFLLETIISRFHVNFWGCLVFQPSHVSAAICFLYIGKGVLMALIPVSRSSHRVLHPLSSLTWAMNKNLGWLGYIGDYMHPSELLIFSSNHFPKIHSAHSFPPQHLEQWKKTWVGWVI